MRERLGNSAAAVQCAAQRCVGPRALVFKPVYRGHRHRPICGDKVRIMRGKRRNMIADRRGCCPAPPAPAARVARAARRLLRVQEPARHRQSASRDGSTRGRAPRDKARGALREFRPQHRRAGRRPAWLARLRRRLCSGARSAAPLRPLTWKTKGDASVVDAAIANAVTMPAMASSATAIAIASQASVSAPSVVVVSMPSTCDRASISRAGERPHSKGGSCDAGFSPSAKARATRPEPTIPIRRNMSMFMMSAIRQIMVCRHPATGSGPIEREENGGRGKD